MTSKNIFCLFVVMLVALATSYAQQGVCPEGEVWMTCGTSCPITCANINNPPQICTQSCVVGCFCAPGTYRDNNGICVANCKTCPPGEVYYDCGSACEPTCDNKEPESCTAQCVSGCFCPLGSYRGADGKCSSTC